MYTFWGEGGHEKEYSLYSCENVEPPVSSTRPKSTQVFMMREAAPKTGEANKLSKERKGWQSASDGQTSTL